MVISASIILLFLFLEKKENIIPKIQLVLKCFTFVAKMISDTAGSKAKTLLVYLCFVLQHGPYSFTVTSHIIVTLIMAYYIYCSNCYRFAKHGFKYLSIFVQVLISTLSH